MISSTGEPSVFAVVDSGVGAAGVDSAGFGAVGFPVAVFGGVYLFNPAKTLISLIFFRSADCLTPMTMGLTTRISSKRSMFVFLQIFFCSSLRPSIICSIMASSKICCGLSIGFVASSPPFDIAVVVDPPAAVIASFNSCVAFIAPGMSVVLSIFCSLNVIFASSETPSIICSIFFCGIKYFTFPSLGLVTGSFSGGGPSEPGSGGGGPGGPGGPPSAAASFAVSELVFGFQSGGGNGGGGPGGPNVAPDLVTGILHFSILFIYNNLNYN